MRIKYTLLCNLLLFTVATLLPAAAMAPIKLTEDQLPKLFVKQKLEKKRFKAYRNYSSTKVDFSPGARKSRRVKQNQSRRNYKPRLGPISFDLRVNPFRMQRNGFALNLDLAKSYDFFKDHDLAKESFREDFLFIGNDIKFGFDTVKNFLSFLPYIEKNS